MELETRWDDIRFEMRYTEFITVILLLLLAAFLAAVATSDPSTGDQVAVGATEVMRMPRITTAREPVHYRV